MSDDLERLEAALANAREDDCGNDQLCSEASVRLSELRLNLRLTRKRLDAERQRAEKTEAALRELVAECTCHPAYSGRDMQDPECPAGLFGDIACEGIGLPPRCQYNRAARDKIGDDE